MEFSPSGLVSSLAPSGFSQTEPLILRHILDYDMIAIDGELVMGDPDKSPVKR
jgi:hypothetical protein